MENEKTSNELSIYELYAGRYVTAIRGKKYGSSGEDQSYRRKLQVLNVDNGYVVLKETKEHPIHREPIVLSLSDWGFADASILDKPKTVWITTDEVEREGKKSTLAAVKVSIKKYRQVYEASDEELYGKGSAVIHTDYCGLCQRFIHEAEGCRDCLLNDESSETCCPEWRTCSRSWDNWPVFRPAVLKMIERLEMEREKLLKPKPYVFQAGDVVKCGNYVRVIVNIDGQLQSFSECGYMLKCGQEQFELFGYEKIGVLQDFITKDKKG